MKLSKKEIAALVRIEREKAFHGDPLILAKAYRQLETEYEKLKRATEKLTAEIAYIAAESFEQTPTAHFPRDHDGIGIALVAYADILEEE